MSTVRPPKYVTFCGDCEHHCGVVQDQGHNVRSFRWRTSKHRTRPGDSTAPWCAGSRVLVDDRCVFRNERASV